MWAASRARDARPAVGVVRDAAKPARDDGVVALARTAGNRWLARAVSRDATAPFRRPAVPPLPRLARLAKRRDATGEHWISVSGQFAMPSIKGKVLFATSGMLDEANRQLEAAGKQGGSHVKLVPGGSATPPEGMVSVEIKLRAERKRPSDQYHRKVHDQNQDATMEFTAHADCAMSAQLVMGSDAGRHETRRIVKREDGGEPEVMEAPPAPNAVSLPGKTGAQSIGARLVYTLFRDVMPKFAAVLQTKVVNPDTNKPVDKRTQRKYRGIAEAILAGAATDDPKRSMEAYLTAYKRIEDSPILNRLFSEKYGVNEAIKPRIGDALVYLSDPNEYQAVKDDNARRLTEHRRAEKVKRHGSADAQLTEEQDAALETGFQENEKWNFHWAGVIFTDGPDYVTFENLSQENEDLRNREWYFQAHGPGSDSFHTKNKRDSHATAHGVTALVTNVAPPTPAPRRTITSV